LPEVVLRRIDARIGSDLSQAGRDARDAQVRELLDTLGQSDEGPPPVIDGPTATIEQLDEPASNDRLVHGTTAPPEDLADGLEPGAEPAADDLGNDDLCL